LRCGRFLLLRLTLRCLAPLLPELQKFLLLFGSENVANLLAQLLTGLRVRRAAGGV